MCTMLTNLQFTLDIHKVIIENIILEDEIEIKQLMTTHQSFPTKNVNNNVNI